MSQFNSIILARKIFIHSGQALWKYNLSDEEFNDLKNSFKYVDRSSQLQPRDCALYYAEWWKRCYNGGKPSKELIFDSLNLNFRDFNADDFYKAAKKGGDTLNFGWIRNRNTLYFKTLLLQGGLPLNHIKNNAGKYRDFLLAILELNPYNIEDFSNKEEIISLLPQSSQNDIVFDSCLQIIRAIIDYDEKSILEFSEISVLSSITRELITKRKNSNLKPLKIKFKYHLDCEKKEIFLNISLPSSINHEDFSNLLNVDTNEIKDSEYSLFVNNNICANFIRRNDSAYKIELFLSKLKISEFLKPEISICDSEGKEYHINHLLDDFVKVNQPTLWTSVNDENTELVLEKSRKTISKDAFLLIPRNEGFDFDDCLNKKYISLLTKEFELVKFENEIVINSINSNEFKFYCNKDKSFDWVFYSEEKKWIIQSNDNIVTGKIRLRAFDKNNQPINNVSVHYKTTKSLVWNDYSANMFLPVGPLDIKMKSGEDEECDTIFNIGDVHLKYHLDVRNPKIEILKSGNFISEIYNSELYSNDITDNTIQFNLTEASKLPSSVKIRFSLQNLARGLILKIKSPFQGVEIINSKNEIIDGNNLFADNLKGFRLIANTNESEYEIVFYNNKNKELRITRFILKSSTSLQEFQSIYDKLFRLFNIIDKDNYLIIKINRVNKNASVQNIKTYELKQFSKNLNWKVNDDSKIIFQNGEDVEFESLFVIPLDCNINYINKIELLKTDDHYEIANEVADKYIVFSNNTADKKIKPEFISLNPDNILTDDNDRIDRIINYKNQLLDEEIDSEIWNKFLIYYYLCKENNLPFSTFDILKSITISSELAAKAFFFLVHHLENSFNKEFSENDFIIFQNDLGFSFNWVDKNDWISKLYDFGFEQNFSPLTRMLNAMSSIFILNEVGRDTSFVLNPEFINLRSRLGSRVLSELPMYRLDFIPEDYRNKIADIGGNEKLILLAGFPLIVSLSITGKKDDIWHPQGESTRRKILYLMELDKQWYRQSLHYYLTLN